jgi:hypothetical protein
VAVERRGENVAIPEIGEGAEDVGWVEAMREGQEGEEEGLVLVAGEEEEQGCV